MGLLLVSCTATVLNGRHQAELAIAAQGDGVSLKTLNGLDGLRMPHLTYGCNLAVPRASDCVLLLMGMPSAIRPEYCILSADADQFSLVLRQIPQQKIHGVPRC